MITMCDWSFALNSWTTMGDQCVILVTGGTGLVGQAIKTIAEGEEKRPNEQWYFASSKDGDLS